MALVLVGLDNSSNLHREKKEWQRGNVGHVGFLALLRGIEVEVEVEGLKEDHSLQPTSTKRQLA